MSIRLNGSTSGYTEIDAPAVAGSNTLVLPTGNGSSGQVLSTNGSGALSWIGAGKILQVVYGTTTTQVEGSFSSATDLGLSASITPSSSSNKILVLVSANGIGVRGTGATYWNGYLVRASTNIGGFGNYLSNTYGNHGFWGASLCVLDEPATTSSTTYKLQGIRGSGSDNCIFNITTGTAGTGTRSTITLMEVAA